MRVDKPQEVLPPNEIRVKRGVGIGRYLKRAHELLTGATATPGTPTPVENIVIKGVSNAVESAVKLAELIKHRKCNLDQTALSNHRRTPRHWIDLGRKTSQQLDQPLE